MSIIESVIVKKNGDIQEKSLNLDELYKSCNFKTKKGFEKQHEYNVDGIIYEIYGKKDGKANTENKYEYPPPIDNVLYFGNMCILKKNKESYEKLNKSSWNEIYNKLYGGFEDLNSDDETRSVDSVIYNDEEYTEDGYYKDGFVVDDNELIEEDYI